MSITIVTDFPIFRQTTSVVIYKCFKVTPQEQRFFGGMGGESDFRLFPVIRRSYFSLLVHFFQPLYNNTRTCAVRNTSIENT